MKFFLSLCLLVFTGQSLFCQQLIQGRVTDAQTREPVSRASVLLPNSAKGGTLTDISGRFSIRVEATTDSLWITCTGYQSQKVALKSAELWIALEPSLSTLNEVVVSARREQQSRKEVPAAISKVSNSVIQDTRATSLYQLLNKVSGVYMVNLGNEQHTMAIRQPIGYNALYLYLEDGLPIRPVGIFNHNALYEINMNEVKDMEVIKGPASSLYGSNSIGGAVNFNTQNPSLGNSGHFSVQGDTYNYSRIDGAGGSHTGKLGVYVSGYAAHQQNSWQDYTNFDKYSGTLKTTYDLNAGTRFTLMGTYNFLNTQTPGSLDSTRFYNRSYASNQRFTYRKVNAFRASARVDRVWNNQNASFLTLFFRDNSTGQLPAYYIQDIRDQQRQYLRSAGQENDLSFRSYGFLMQHRAGFKFLNSELVAGLYLDHSPSSFQATYLQIQKDVLRNYYTGYTNTDSLIDHYRLNLFNSAAYMQYEMHPVTPLRIVAGLRYDHLVYDFRNQLPPSQTKYKQQEQNNYNVLAPKIGATYDFGKGKGLYTNFSVGFQPPETSTLYSSRQLVPLKQATFYNYELGGWMPLLQNKLNLELSFYDLEGKNEIISVLMPDNSTQNQNAAATRHMGVEYTLTYFPSSQWLFRFSGTNARHTYVQYSEIQSGQTYTYNGQRMSNAPNWIANTELSWKPSFMHGFRSSIEWQHIGAYATGLVKNSPYQGYDFFNLRLGYDLKGNFAKGTGIWLNVLNLGNKLYATNVIGNQYGLTYTAAAPRTFSIGLKYSFADQKSLHREN
ncbi:MAG TPA: TonB-dependent receptor [Daejeonella sp.]|nr:TonB-dependent receptor [Daejeonella sp.]